MAYGSDESFKLPMRRWLSDLVDKKEIEGLEWLDFDKKRYIKIPWTKRDHPGWESCDRVVTAWAEHQHREEKKGVKSDFSTLKANFRNAIHKSEDFMEEKSLSQTDNQSYNFKVYKILTRAEVETRKEEKKQAVRKRKQPKSPLRGKFLCSQQNYDDKVMKTVSDKDFTIPETSSQISTASPLDSPYMTVPTQASGISMSSPFTLGYSPNNMNFQNYKEVSPFQMLDQDLDATVPMQCSSDKSCSDPVSQGMQMCDIQCTQDLASMGHSVWVQPNQGAECPVAELLRLHNVPMDDLHMCELTVSYNNAQVWSGELRNTDMGYRIFYGDERELKHVLEIKPVMEEDIKDYSFPPIKLPPPKKEYKRLEEILNLTELGFLLRYDKDTFSFYLKRLCQSQIFYLDPHVPMHRQHPIKIERKEEVCIFSYQMFLTVINEAVSKGTPEELVYPIVQVSVGSRSNLEYPNPSPRGVKIRILVNSLKNYLEQQADNGELSIRQSNPNDFDQFLDAWKQLSVK